MEDHTSVEEWHCELQPVDAEQSGVLFVTLEGLEDVDLDAEAVSGRTTLFAEGAVIADGKLKIPKGARKQFGKIEKRGPSAASNKGQTQRQEAGNFRKLAPIEPDMKRVLAVRVVAPDATTTANLTTLSGDIFGTGMVSTAVNLNERFKSCSHGETLMNPYAGTTRSGVSIQNGVVQVQINTAVAGQTRTTVHNAVTKALSSYLGISDLASTFDHVMVCLPAGTSGGWIAYGTLPVALHTTTFSIWFLFGLDFHSWILLCPVSQGILLASWFVCSYYHPWPIQLI